MMMVARRQSRTYANEFTNGSRLDAHSYGGSSSKWLAVSAGQPVTTIPGTEDMPERGQNIYSNLLPAMAQILTIAGDTGTSLQLRIWQLLR